MHRCWVSSKRKVGTRVAIEGKKDDAQLLGRGTVGGILEAIAPGYYDGMKSQWSRFARRGKSGVDRIMAVGEDRKRFCLR